jgi:hypothetical protein
MLDRSNQADDDFFTLLVEEAEQRAFSGWDFSYIEDRTVMAPLPWSYASIVLSRVRGNEATAEGAYTLA